MRDEIVVFGHNDLDQLGCMLNIEYALPDYKKIHYHTNYKDINDITHDVGEYIQKYNSKLLMITDISFAEHKHLLKYLVQICEQTQTKIIYIDHHAYPEDFFDEFDFKYSYNNKKSATQLTYEFFNNQGKNKSLDNLTYLIDIYDIWQMEKEGFKLSLNLNDYFWEYVKDSSLDNLFAEIVNNNYKMPRNYIDRIKFFQEDSKKSIQKFRDNKLIHCDGYTTIAFVDEYFSEILYSEFMNGINVVIIANSYGIVRVRFNSINDMSKEIKEKIKFDIIGTLDKGHLNAFSLKVENNSFKNLMKEIKRITDIIQKYKG